MYQFVLHPCYSTDFGVTRSSLPAEVGQQTDLMSLLVEENGTELYRYVVSVGKLIWKLGTFAINLIFLHLRYSREVSQTTEYDMDLADAWKLSISNLLFK